MYNASEEEIKDLIHDLDSPDKETFESAIYYLQEIEKDLTIAPLLYKLQWASPHCKEGICEIFADYKDVRCISPLLGLVNDPVESVQLAALKALEDYINPAVLPDLEDKLYTGTLMVRKKVLRYMGILLMSGIRETQLIVREFIRHAEEPIELRYRAVQKLRFLEPDDLQATIRELEHIPGDEIQRDTQRLKNVLAMKTDPHVRSKVARTFRQFITEKDFLKKISLHNKLILYGSLAAGVLAERYFVDGFGSKNHFDTSRLLLQLGRKAIPSISKYLRTMNSFDDSNELFLYGVHLNQIKVCSPGFASVLLDLLNRANVNKPLTTDSILESSFYFFKTAVHKCLAYCGRTDALNDLIEMVSSQPDPPHPAVFSAVLLFGGKAFVKPLLNIQQNAKSEDDRIQAQRTLRIITGNDTPNPGSLF